MLHDGGTLSRVPPARSSVVFARGIEAGWPRRHAARFTRARCGVSRARTTQAGQQSKAEQVYQYLTGARFKQRIEAIVERFKDMRDDIDKERKFMMKAWAKREAQVNVMIESTVGMVGDLHGIMGQAMPEIEVIEEPPMLEGRAA